VRAVDLHALAPCFEGVIPSTIATCSADGVPNVAMLSQVHLVDATHVALSRQFFNKTTRNFAENPLATVWVWNPLTFETWRLRARFERSETAGSLFESMAARIQAIASHTGMAGVFRLIASDVFEVLAVERVEGVLMPPVPGSHAPLPARPEPPERRPELWVLQRISERVNAAEELDALLDSVLQTLDEDLGLAHASVLLADESGQKLFTVASHGFGESGAGAEVAFGEGLIGTVAKERRPVRLSRLSDDLRAGRGVRDRVEKAGGAALRPEIPLPGLPDAQSYLGLPLVVRNRLVGVLSLEARDTLSFDAWHQDFLAIVANQLAMDIEQLASQDHEAPAPGARVTAKPPAEPRTRRLCFYRSDDCVFVDDEYLIRNLPGRILWKLLRAHQQGRTEFTNRELRLDASLGLPELKDNLESRLILLRKRLEQKCPDIRLARRGRGRFALELCCAVEFDERP